MGKGGEMLCFRLVQISRYHRRLFGQWRSGALYYFRR